MSSEARAAAATQVRCSFCGKPSSDIEKVIAGPGVYICNECTGLCNDILAEPGARIQCGHDIVWRVIRGCQAGNRRPALASGTPR